MEAIGRGNVNNGKVLGGIGEKIFNIRVEEGVGGTGVVELARIDEEGGSRERGRINLTGEVAQNEIVQLRSVNNL